VPERARVQVGLIGPPGLTPETGTQLAAELGELLSERYPDFRWEVRPRSRRRFR
jgi:hypothetical protein